MISTPRKTLVAAATLGALQAAVHWRLWTPIDGARRFLAVEILPGPLYGAAWPIVHAWLLALGIWVWTRERSPEGAAVAAAVASFALWAEPERGIALGIAWLPWFLWAAERFADERAPRWGAVAALLGALAVAGGLPVRGAPVDVAPFAARLPLLYLGFLPVLASTAATTRRGLLLAAGTIAALALGRAPLAVLLGAALAAEGIQHLRGAAGRVIALGAATALLAAAATAWLSHLPNRAEPPRDLAALIFAEAAVATWALHQLARDGRRVFHAACAAICALALWFDHHERLEQIYRLRPSQSAIASNVTSSTPASTTQRGAR